MFQFLKYGNNVVSVSAAYSAGMTDKFILVNATAGAVNITLPFASGNLGKEIAIIKTDATGNAVTATPRGLETVNGAGSASTTAKLTPIKVVSDNSNWIIW